MQGDPLVKYLEGYYYYICTQDGKELWASKLHIVNDKCYIYVVCDNGLN